MKTLSADGTVSALEMTLLERDRLKAALGRVWEAARSMSLDHPEQAAAIFTAIGDTSATSTASAGVGGREA